MSAFLGPIHHWLYNKIEVEENILQELLEHTKTTGFDTTLLEKGLITKYGERTVGALEDIIATDNIHGWLQSKIASVESRLAYTVTELLSKRAVSKNEISEIFSKNAIACASKVNLEDITPSNIYQEIYNYLLAGMPCDRVNEVVDNTPDFVKWVTAIDIHEQYWIEVSGNVENYHTFEEKWITSFVNTISSDFKYSKDGNLNIVERA